MDIIDTNATEFFATETFDKSYFPLPESDYDANGQLRPVRKRMLKKLLAYEMKALFKPMLVVAVILFAISLFLGVYGLTVNLASDYGVTYWSLALVPYVYAVGAMLVTPWIAASKRYKKHFFENEGYLTFSIPASAEEHLLAKRVSGLLMMLIADLFALLSVCVSILPFCLRTSDFAIFQIFGNLFKMMFAGNTVHITFVVLEMLVLSVVGSVFFFTLLGAWNCLRHRGVKRRTSVVVGLVAYIAFVIFEAVLVSIAGDGSSALIVMNSRAFVHISICFQILLYLFLIWLCTRFELRTLKYKLNLK